jgi:pimeloyl-ACP methyl ester carboxylesterase/DNA-binding CsgD family transcriptional regulator
MDSKTLSDLIGLIYDAARDVNQWPRLLQALADESDSLLRERCEPNHLTGKELVELLCSHLGRAQDLASDMTKSCEEYAIFEKLLERLPLGIIIVDGESRVHVCNDKMSSFILNNRGIGTTDRMLSGNTFKETMRLREVVRSVSEDPNGTGKTIHLSSLGSALPLSALVIPLGPSTPRGVNDKGMVAVLVAAPEMHSEIPTDTLRSFYRLTKAEARLVASLLKDPDISAIAEEFGISKHTVRNQLKSVFEKTGTHRQAELVQQVLTGPAMLTIPSANSDCSTHRNPLTAPFYRTPPTSRMHQTMRLPDGRRLGFAEYGVCDGHPVMLMHSASGSRLERHPDEHDIERCGIRLIIPDRPGVGLSEGERDSTFLRFANDVSSLADHLTLGKFSVIGYSLGGVFGLACAHELPDRIARLVVVSSIAPFKSVWELGGMYAPWRLFFAAGKFAHPLMELLVALTGSKTTAEMFFGEMLRHLPLADRAVIADAAIRDRLLESTKENFRRRGFYILPEMLMVARHWGFDVGDIVVPTVLWHGELDRIVPLGMARLLAGKLPSCHTRFLPNAGHFLLFHCWRQILLSAISNDRQ